MKDSDLIPGDILLFPVTDWGIFRPLVRLLVTWGHVALYFTETKRGLPLVIESIGRGVTIRSLYAYTGETARVLRHSEVWGARAAVEAEHIADNPSSWYGYWDIPRFVLPKLLAMKVGRLLPARWSATLWLLARSYRRNSAYICSELIVEAYRRAGAPLVAEKTIPLPDDLAASPKLSNQGDLVIGAPPPPTKT